MKQSPWLIPVGGFLGAGKTTLLMKAAATLQAKGARVAALLNDQGADLVDTALVQQHSIDADQVAGGCFCCLFTDFLEAARRLREHSPDYIFVEPVGSCTDLVATILRPLQRDFPAEFRLAPLTVVVDPETAAGPRDADVDFLFRNQLAEADIVCLSKADRKRADVPIDSPAPVLRVSGVTGEGVEDWLEMVLSERVAPGASVLQIDYGRYAEAEAALGWLNYRVQLQLREPLSPALVAGPWFDRLLDAKLPIVHMKLLDQSESGYVKVAVTGAGQEPAVEGNLDASPARRHDLLLNLRASAPPETLEAVIRTTAATLPGRRHSERLQCFRPSPPKPERRVV